jgi:hypothetical protein
MCGQLFLSTWQNYLLKSWHRWGINAKQENAAQYLCRLLLERRKDLQLGLLLYTYSLPFASPPSRAIQIYEDSTDKVTSSWEIICTTEI